MAKQEGWHCAFRVSSVQDRCQTTAQGDAEKTSCKQVSICCGWAKGSRPVRNKDQKCSRRCWRIKSAREPGRVVAVGQCQAILQVVEGQHDHSEPFLSGFKGLQTEIAQSQGIFQVSVIDLNGLITNDKFCMVRTGKLKLNHWRLPLKRRIGVAGEKGYSATTDNGVRRKP